jgi:hypothetical protein
VTVRISTQPRRLTTDLTFSRSAARDYLRIKNSFKDQIDRALGTQGADYDDLQWVARPDKSESHIKVFREIADPYDESKWPEYYAWLATNALLLHKWGKR